MKVKITPVAQKDFNHLNQKDKEKIKKKLSFLESNLIQGKKLSGDLSELRSLRAWPYRIIYYLNKDKKVIYVVSIFHRQGAYK